jgi:hypothetical protein
MEFKKIFFPYRVQALECEHSYLALLSFLLVLYNKRFFTLVYATHLCSVQECLHKIYLRVCKQSDHHKFFRNLMEQKIDTRVY